MRYLASLVLIACAVLGLPASSSAAIAYLTTTGGTAAGNPIWVAADDGSDARALGVRGAGVAISPDGTRVAFLRNPYGARPTLVILTIATSSRIETSAATPLMAYPEPAWSPDSTRLLMGTQSATADGIVTGNGLVEVDAATGVVTTIVSAQGNAVGSFTWSPSGTQLAYDLERFAAMYRARIMVANADGSSPASLGSGQNPVWGPSLIALQRFTRARWRGMTLYHAQVWTVDPLRGAASARQVTRFTGAQLLSGPYASQWSPDGRTLIGTIGGDDVIQPIRIAVPGGRIRYLRDERGALIDDTLPVAVSADGASLLVNAGVIAGAARFDVVSTAGGRGRRFLAGALAVSVTPTWQP